MSYIFYTSQSIELKTLVDPSQILAYLSSQKSVKLLQKAEQKKISPKTNILKALKFY